MKNEILQVGKGLVEHAAELECHGQYGIMDELFPYVFEASKRMSLREICRWIEGRGVKVSAMALSKALRQPVKYWGRFIESIEPSARVVGRAYDVSWQTVLLNRELFESFEGATPKFVTTDPGASFDTLDNAYAAIKERWYALSDETLREAGAYVLASEHEEERTQNDESRHRTKRRK